MKAERLLSVQRGDLHGDGKQWARRAGSSLSARARYNPWYAVERRAGQMTVGMREISR